MMLKVICKVAMPITILMSIIATLHDKMIFSIQFLCFAILLTLITGQKL